MNQKTKNGWSTLCAYVDTRYQKDCNCRDCLLKPCCSVPCKKHATWSNNLKWGDDARL
jgi:sulfatase maturation enzyme AslB (radical SAM superfamily)